MPKLPIEELLEAMYDASKQALGITQAISGRASSEAIAAKLNTAKRTVAFAEKYVPRTRAPMTIDPKTTTWLEDAITPPPDGRSRA